MVVLFEWEVRTVDFLSTCLFIVRAAVYNIFIYHLGSRALNSYLIDENCHLILQYHIFISK